MRIAFYAPLKAPGHPVASGDREIARALVDALRRRGHAVAVASHLRTFDRRGDASRQRRLGAIGERVARRLVARYAKRDERPDLWFTYHLHHKAPDVVGPAVCRALRIPYVVAEASVAGKQRDGAWSVGYAQALAALRAADGVVSLNPVDVEGVRAAVPDGTLLESLPPFVDVDALRSLASAREVSTHARVRLVTVAMMREGAKLASYRLLADALARIGDARWELAIAGDGEARRDVEQAFARFDASRVRFAGALDRGGVARLLCAADLFVWPAIDEAFGMALLEAQAFGLPVVAGRSGGVSAVVDDGTAGLLPRYGDAAAFAAAMRRLIEDDALRSAMGRAALARVRERHDVAPASARLDAFLARVRARRAC